MRSLAQIIEQRSRERELEHTSLDKCAKCNAKLPARALGELCPKCLAKLRHSRWRARHRLE